MVRLGRWVLRMTAIKQVAVTRSTHVVNLGKYINDERALARSSQHIADEARWCEEMDATREAYGHNAPSRSGAKNTFMFHQIIAWNPDECDVNGGCMGPEECMRFAREWVERRYPDQEAAWVLHRERCERDGTERYAAHIAINRTNLETGLRLNEGPSKYAKVERANAMRDMDRKWGLSQLEAGVRNSRAHAMQPTRAEREMAERGALSKKEALRQRVSFHIRSVSMEAPGGNLLRELSKRLESDGIRMTVSKSEKQLQFETEDGFKVNGNRLGRGYSISGVTHGLGMEGARGLGLDEDQGFSLQP